MKTQKGIQVWNQIISWLIEMETLRYDATLRPENLRETVSSRYNLSRRLFEP